MNQKLCLEPIEYSIIQENGTEPFMGYYFCQKLEGHEGHHRITTVKEI